STPPPPTSACTLSLHDALPISWWQADEALDINAHVLRATLPGAGGKEELEAFVSELASTPLDPARPLWQFHVIDNYLGGTPLVTDRESTRLNSSHVEISYAVFC